MPTDDDTYRQLVVPKFLAVGWDDEPHPIIDQAGKPDAQHFDLFCDLSFNAPVLAPASELVS